MPHVMDTLSIKPNTTSFHELYDCPISILLHTLHHLVLQHKLVLPPAVVLHDVALEVIRGTQDGPWRNVVVVEHGTLPGIP